MRLNLKRQCNQMDMIYLLIAWCFAIQDGFKLVTTNSLIISNTHSTLKSNAIKYIMCEYDKEVASIKTWKSTNDREHAIKPKSR